MPKTLGPSRVESSKAILVVQSRKAKLNLTKLIVFSQYLAYLLENHKPQMRKPTSCRVAKLLV